MAAVILRENYDQLLHNLLEQVLLLGSMVEDNVHCSVNAFIQRNHHVARRVAELDQNINDKRYAIEDTCVTLIVTQQPMARDARFIIAVLEISTELERMGDYAKGIAKITQLMGENPVDATLLAALQQMEEIGLQMLRRSLDAFYHRDIKVAREIPSVDDRVDRLYYRIYNHLANSMIYNQTSVENANYVLWAAHNLERLADRVANICERTVYMETGELLELATNEDIA